MIATRKLVAAIKVLMSIVLSPFLWFLYFISTFIPRNEKTIVFGTHLKMPSGNIYAFFKHCCESDKMSNYNKIWIAKNKNELLFLKSKNLPVEYKYSINGVFNCLKSRYYCYSSYPSDISFSLSGCAKMINLWHGTPLKKIERDIEVGTYSIRYKYDYLFKLIQPWAFIRPDKLIASSEYEIDCFKTAFDVKETCFVKTFPPRLLDLVNEPHKQGITRQILYAPTFRDSGKSISTFLEWDKLNKFCLDNKIVFLIKTHPSDNTLRNEFNYSNIKIIDNHKNIYDLLSDVDLIVTDYSSIFFDAIYLKENFIFYWPDFDDYQCECRGFYCDPSKVFFSQSALNFNELLKLIVTKNDKKIFGVNKYMAFPMDNDYPVNFFLENV